MVILGLHNIKQISAQNILVKFPLQYINHPSYNSNFDVYKIKIKSVSLKPRVRLNLFVSPLDKTLDSDIGLIKIEAVDFTSLPESIRPSCLPTDSSMKYSNSIATVAGWGTLSSGNESNDSV